MPTISVVLPNFNDSQFLPTSLAALAAEANDIDELLIVDDCSTDNSIEVMERFRSRFKNFRIVRNESQRGPSPVCNWASDQVTSEFVYFAAADDFVLPGFFKSTKEILEQSPQAGISCGDLQCVLEGSGETWVKHYIDHSSPGFISPEDLSRKIVGSHIPGYSAVINVSALKKAGGLRPELQWWADGFLSLVVAFRNGLCYQPRPVTGALIRAGSYACVGAKDDSRRNLILRRVLDLLETPEYADVAEHFFRSAILRNSGPEFVELAKADPSALSDHNLGLLFAPFTDWAKLTNAASSTKRPAAYLAQHLYAAYD